ncbi:MAG: SGNH/GDSL hydrolase family protein [Planctomycetes bacterium]|nr:SGNH/GDSL hydrolase family protein [Planctomycetota bacterium]
MEASSGLKRGLYRLTATAAGFVLALSGLEFGYRGLASLGLMGKSWAPGHERIDAFREHVGTGLRGMFSPKAFVGYTLQGEGINSHGFADKEWELDAPRGVLRVACLGGSTTQDGVKAERDGTYPIFLSRILGRRLKREVEVMNFGVNGWTTAESLVNYSILVSRFEPDLVVIHHSVNDVWPRLYPGYRADYSHYRVQWRDVELSELDAALISWSDLWAASRLQDQALVGIRERVIRRVDGVPVQFEEELSPDTLSGYRENLIRLCRLVRSDGATPVLMTMPYSAKAGGMPERWLETLGDGTADNNAVMEEVSASEGVVLADAAGLFQSDPAEYDKLFADYVHMRPPGNRAKAVLIADAVQAAKLFR